jgi:hypothetical protein
MVGNEWLSVIRINAIMQGITDTREQTPDLVWSRRIPQVDASAGEILMREIRRVVISDVISHDSKAMVYTTGRANFETSNIPKIKHGFQFTESQIRDFLQLRADGTLPDGSQYLDFMTRVIDDIELGIRHRGEQLRMAMLFDGVTYDRFGIKITGTWGMPADLNVVAGIPWTDHVNADPVGDIQTLNYVASTRYGITYPRLSLTTPTFQHMIACTNFQNKVRQFLAPNVNFVNLNQLDFDTMKNLALRSIGGITEIEFNDSRYWSQDIATTDFSSVPFHPHGKVILSNPANDGSARAWDYANAPVIESMMVGLAGTATTGRLPGARRGPLGFATVQPELNPPDITYWGVQSAFPRKKMLQVNAVLDVGSSRITDSVAVGVPFI